MRKKRVIYYISCKIELDLCKAMKYERAFNMIADNWSIPEDIISKPVHRMGFDQNSWYYVMCL
jgi:hypothetical protein